MGGGGNYNSWSSSSSEKDSWAGHNSPHESTKSGVSRRFASGDDDEVWSEKNYEGIPDMNYCTSSIMEEASERQRIKFYDEVWSSYQGFPTIHKLDQAKAKLLSYTPGSWAEIEDGVDLSEYKVPKTTSLLLIGPKGSGKSSLVNKISRVLDKDLFTLERAQVTYNSPTEDGTCFLHEYMIPRKSGSFSLYDTRSLSDDLSENRELFNVWMTMGVCDGELVTRNSDSTDFKARLKCKSRRRRSTSYKVRAVDFVVFVVNAVSVLESIDSLDENKKRYSQLIAENFKNPLLSYKDDKPVVAVTHGDILSVSDRVRVRIHLGEILGIPPTTQVFDIPECDDLATELTIAEMLTFCLDRADRNLPTKEPSEWDVRIGGLIVWIVWTVLIMAFLLLKKLSGFLS
ncbi:hypothetical protein ABFX02_04G221100 [Erythranthe guttata]